MEGCGNINKNVDHPNCASVRTLVQHPAAVQLQLRL